MLVSTKNVGEAKDEPQGDKKLANVDGSTMGTSVAREKPRGSK